MCVCGDGERERERERLQRISEHENKKGGSSPLCVYDIRESESVCESEKESKKERERERGDMCVSACAGTIQRELPTTRTFCCKYEVTTSVFDAGRLRRLVTPLGVLPI